MSAQISSAVVRRWISGFAGFLNCCSITAPGVAATISSALATASRISEPGVNTISAPSIRRNATRSCEMRSGMTSVRAYPFAAATNASAMPVLPLVGSTSVAPGLSTPRRSASSISATPTRSLTLPHGLRDSIFTKIRAPAVSRRCSSTIGVRPTD